VSRRSEIRAAARGPNSAALRKCASYDPFDELTMAREAVYVDDEGLSPVTHGWLALQVRPYGSPAAQTPKLAVDDPYPARLR
jgi:hypothetical protein